MRLQGLDGVDSHSDETAAAAVLTFPKTTPTSSAPPTHAISSIAEATPTSSTDHVGGGPPPGIAMTGPNTCDECDEERPRGWVNEEIDEGWFCAECWSVFFDDDDTETTTTATAPASHAVTTPTVRPPAQTTTPTVRPPAETACTPRGSSDGDDGFDSLDEGTEGAVHSLPVPRQDSNETVCVHAVAAPRGNLGDR